MVKNFLASTTNLFYIMLFVFYSGLLVLDYQNWMYIPLGIILLLALFSQTGFTLEKSQKQQLLFLTLLLLLYSCSISLISLIREDIRNHVVLKMVFFLAILSFFIYKIKFKEKYFFYIIAISAIIMGFSALYNKYILDLTRAFDQVHHIMILVASGIAMTTGLMCLVIAFYYFRKKNQFQAVFFLIASIFGIMVGILSESRGSWLAFPIVLFVLAYLYRKEYKNSIIFCTISVLIIGSILYLIPPTGVAERIHLAIADVQLYINGQDKTTSLGMRFELWKAAWLAFLSSPVFGVGEVGMKSFIHHQIELGVISPQAAVFNHAHNQILDILSKYGVFSATILLLLYFYPMIIFFKKRKQLPIDNLPSVMAELGIVLIISTFIYSLTDVFLHFNFSVAFWGLTLIILFSYQVAHENSWDDQSD